MKHTISPAKLFSSKEHCQSIKLHASFVNNYRDDTLPPVRRWILPNETKVPLSIHTDKVIAHCGHIDIVQSADTFYVVNKNRVTKAPSLHEARYITLLQLLDSVEQENIRRLSS